MNRIHSQNCILMRIQYNCFSVSLDLEKLVSSNKHVRIYKINNTVFREVTKSKMAAQRIENII